ncbi:DNA invertase Pin-like site-specific DNA recombinase [Sphingomonas endophytica]|uniref:DNA invertase Pin-like site-specific DNA recombinase n=1 Tax=Sphingomonas endophytica TaxID=869719 RepID=A0A7X0MNK2_9SPHN|nr:recombinase family protein [Sphingomonas endophytica]MBB6505444.1 DNA invertase Pin-like site-specific DNA recombinase [Sphingomonas endophytica]
MLVGYARVSSAGQSLDVQFDALKAAGCEKLFAEKESGTSTDNRKALADSLDFIREGDTLLICRIDRLARSVGDLETIVATIKRKGAFLKAIEQPIDTSSPAGVAFLQMLGVFAQFETAIRKERQAEGIAKAKADGRYKGRKPTVDADAVRALKAEGIRPVDIAAKLGIARASVYRALGAA